MREHLLCARRCANSWGKAWREQRCVSLSSASARVSGVGGGIVMYLFTYQIFNERSLCARPCASHWMTWSSVPPELIVSWGWGRQTSEWAWCEIEAIAKETWRWPLAIAPHPLVSCVDHVGSRPQKLSLAHSGKRKPWCSRQEQWPRDLGPGPGLSPLHPPSHVIFTGIWDECH